MELPDWVVDEIVQPAKPIAVRLVVMLYRHGRQQVGSNGERRVYWRGSLQQLARLIGADKKSVINAQRELVEAGFLTIHNANRPNAPHAISAPYDKARSGNFPPPARFDNCTHDDDPDPSSSSEKERDHHHFSRDSKGVEIFHRLAEYGVSNPGHWLARYGVERCRAAVAHLETRPVPPQNPAGYLYALVTSPNPPRIETRQPTDDSFEARKARYGQSPLSAAIAAYHERRSRFMTEHT